MHAAQAQALIAELAALVHVASYRGELDVADVVTALARHNFWPAKAADEAAILAAAEAILPPDVRAHTQVHLGGHGPDAGLCIPAQAGLPDVLAAAFALGVLATKASDFVPHVHLHAELAPSEAQALGLKRGRTLVALLAQMGLSGRPWHLWLGPRQPVALLSPYARDLAPALLAWQNQAIAAGPQTAAYDITTDPCAPYAAAEAFVSTDAALALERTETDRAAGIITVELDGQSVFAIDLARASPNLWDGRLGDLNPYTSGHANDAPILLCVDWQGSSSSEVTSCALVAHVVHTLAAQARSITVCQPGLLNLQGQPWQAAHTLVPVDGTAPWCVAPHGTPTWAQPTGHTPAAADSNFDVLPVGLAHAQAWSWAAEAAQHGAPYVAAGRIGGGAHLASLLTRLTVRGSLPHALPTVWALTQSSDGPLGPDRVACAWLKNLLAPMPPAAAAPPAKPAPRVRPRGLRA